MFTTGSKLFLGASTLTLVTLVVTGVTTGGPAGWTATISLLGAMVGLMFLTGINFYVRDSNVSALEAEAVRTSAAAQQAPGRSYWPVAGAFGAAILAVGCVTTPFVFKIGVVAVAASIVEWMVQAWSERASSDATYNASLRKRLLHPLEFPVLAAVALGVLIYSFSRIMLYVSKDAGPAVFGIIATLVLLGGVMFALTPSIKQSVTIGVVAISALGLISTGAVMAIDGQRHIEEHPIIANDPAVCSSNEETEIDHNGSQTVAAKSNLAAQITLENGVLTATQIGGFTASDTITLQRANDSNILFRNLDAEHARLTAQIGLATPSYTCTTLVDEGGAQLMTLRITQSSPAGVETPYTLSVPGLESSPIKIVVP